MSSESAASEAALPPIRRRRMLDVLGALSRPRVALMLGLGFASGLPNLLIFDTLSAWLRDSGLSLKVISFFSLATLAYSVKFLWAPVIDRLSLPGLTGWLGQRRAWMLVSQIAVIAAGLVLAWPRSIRRTAWPGWRASRC